MSLSQERPSNPAKHFLNFRGGEVVYYDKESQENVTVQEPIEFIVLDQLATVKGYNTQENTGFWSNEVRRVGQDTLTVRTRNGMKASGVWKDIKESPELRGAKYTTSAYVAIKGRNGLEINNLSINGAALGQWIEFSKAHKVNQIKVVISKWEDGKVGSVTFKKPIFEAVEMSDAEKEEAVALDKELQAYFAQYFDYVPEPQHDDVVIDPKDFDDDQPISLDDIPF